MLRVDQRLAFVGFPSLKQEWRPAGWKGKRFKTEHAAQLQRAAPELTKCHRHEPVLRFEFGYAARSALGIHSDDRVVVKHQQPVAGLLVMHVHGRRCGIPRGA